MWKFNWLLVLVTNCVLAVYAQHGMHGQQQQQRPSWEYQKFIDVETKILDTRRNLDVIFSLVQTERQNQFPGTPGGAPSRSNAGVAFQSFFSDVEARLTEVENTTRELSKIMRICPDKVATPAEPKKVVVKSFTQGNTSTIVVSWEPVLNPETSNQQYKVYFQPIEPDGQILQREVVFRICDASQTSASITDLSPLRRYQIKVGVVDGTTVESHSRAETVMTPDVIPSKVRNIRAKEGINLLLLDWNPPAIRGEVLKYYIYYNDTFTGYTGIQTVPGDRMSAKLTNLTEGTPIVVSMTAESNNGESDKTDPMIFNTQMYTPPPVRSFQIVTVNQSALMLNLSSLTYFEPYKTKYEPWMLDGGVVMGLEIYYTDFEYREGKKILPNMKGNVTYITGLEPSVGYYVSVTPFTRKARSQRSPYEFARTTGSVPTRVRRVRCITLRNDPPLIKLSWEPPKHKYSAKSPNYTVNWGVENGVYREELIDNNSVSWTSDYLDDNLKHKFNIAALNELGPGPSVEVTLTTPPRNFSTPENIQVNRIKNARGTRLLVSWDRPMGRSIKKYRVLHRPFKWVYTGRWTITEVNQPDATNVTIPIANPSYSFIVVVRAVEASGTLDSSRYIRDIPCNINYRPTAVGPDPTPGPNEPGRGGGGGGRGGKGGGRGGAAGGRGGAGRGGGGRGGDRFGGGRGGVGNRGGDGGAGAGGAGAGGAGAGRGGGGRGDGGRGDGGRMVGMQGGGGRMGQPFG